MMQKLNLSLPGNPRYQPKNMMEVFGYDYLYRTLADVEFANIDVLYDIGVISHAEWLLLTPETREQIRQIPQLSLIRLSAVRPSMMFALG